MEITFKYQGKIITTPNLEKKLKRMKISIDDIEIIKKEIVKEEKEEENDLKVIKVKSNEDDYTWIFRIPVNEGLPPISKLFKTMIWNPKTKTGVKNITREYLMTLYYDK
jgi:hypothetical protein